MSLADLPPGQHADHVRNHWWWRPGWWAVVAEHAPRGRVTGGTFVAGLTPGYSFSGGTLPAATMARRIGTASSSRNPTTKNVSSEMIATR